MYIDTTRYLKWDTYRTKLRAAGVDLLCPFLGHRSDIDCSRCRTFVCAKCRRRVSWDCGAADDESELCDDCWAEKAGR